MTVKNKAIETVTTETVATVTSPIDLSGIKTAINEFMALPVYMLLGAMPSTLQVGYFVTSKENTNPLKGSAESFLSTVFEFDFALPEKIAEPDIDLYDDMRAYKADMLAYKGLHNANNITIDAVASTLRANSITEKYSKYLRCMTFLRATIAADPSAFEVDDLLELNELPSPIKTKILAVYQAAFRANPVLLTMGSTVDLIAADPRCNLDSAEGIDAIVKIQDSHKGAKYGFVSKELMIAVVKQIKSSVNAPTLVKIFDSLVSNGATSKNASTILSNLKKLF